mmetsp:Transcript_885/g.2648  ORF Transcript_885/g.2648 Transcript_885/m.2648 type:complete len:109 (-) Transcript_885:2472-2798(-)
MCMTVRADAAEKQLPLPVCNNKGQWPSIQPRGCGNGNCRHVPKLMLEKAWQLLFCVCHKVQQTEQPARPGLPSESEGIRDPIGGFATDSYDLPPPPAHPVYLFREDQR